MLSRISGRSVLSFSFRYLRSVLETEDHAPVVIYSYRVDRGEPELLAEVLYFTKKCCIIETDITKKEGA